MIAGAYCRATIPRPVLLFTGLRKEPIVLHRAHSAAAERGVKRMKNGHRFVDVDMHVIEPPDLFNKYLDPAFRHRVTTPVLGPRPPGSRPLGLTPWLIDGTPINLDGLLTQYNKRRTPVITRRARAAIGFALESGYDPERQTLGMEMEGIDIAVLFPSAGLAFMSRDGMDPSLSHAICRAYNDWIYDFCSYSPALLKMAAMLPVHDVNLACQELK